jgi:putative ABC transport system permease protein
VNSLRFALVHAWREGRAAPRRLVLLAATVALGVGALTAINGFTANVRRSIGEQSRALLGADIRLSANHAFNAAADSLLTTAAAGGKVSRVVSFDAMAFAPKGRTTRLVDVEAVDGGWPFYGTVRTDPAGAWGRLPSGHVAVIDPVLLTGLGVSVGDTLAIGSARLVVAGTIGDIPGDVGIMSAFAPRVYIAGSDVASTGLLGFGARVSYQAYVELPAGTDVAGRAAPLRTALRAQSVSIRTATDDERDLNESLTTLARYLGLVALAALLLGGIGVASASHELVTRRIDTIAVLRCLGASGRLMLLAYLLQAAAVGMLGGAIGAAGGTFLQLALPRVLHGFIPVDVHVTPDAATIALGVGIGLWVTIAFALGPLLAVRRVPPLAALRRDAEPAARDPWRWGAWVVIIGSVVALAALQVRSFRSAVGFSIGLAVAVGALALAAFLLIRAARKVPASLPYPWRQGIANLHRPANQTGAVVLALGFGAFILITLMLVERSLVARFAVDGRPDRPDLVVFDVQPDQVPGIQEILRQGGAPAGSFTAIVPMRIRSLKGRAVSDIIADTLGDSSRARSRRTPGWALRREYRSTYRDSAASSERITAGRWWHPGAGTTEHPVPISVEEGLARDLGVGVGDTLTWDVQGVEIATRVANLRHVEWARFEPNFFVVFPDGPLTRAPQSLVTLTRASSPDQRATLQRAIVERYPNVSVIDASLLARNLGDLIARVTLAVRFLALFCLAAGAVVLMGAVAASRRQRLREGVLLKTLGATRRQVIQIALAEYAALGVLAAAAATLLAVSASWLLMHSRFELPFVLPLGELLAVAAGLAALSAGVGLWTGREVFQDTPLEVLRAE